MKHNLQTKLEQMFADQLSTSVLFRNNYDALYKMQKRDIPFDDGHLFRLQYNPGRKRSATAKVEEGKVSRPCFLCRGLRPAEQLYFHVYAAPEVETYDSHTEDRIYSEDYELLVNPYPITNHHFTFALARHIPQKLTNDKLSDMKLFAQQMPDYMIFFNGACCGASAPDHFHFQAVPKDELPFFSWTEELLIASNVTTVQPQIENSDYVNVLCWYDSSEDMVFWRVIKRKAHRPWQYTSADEKSLCIISPASLEFCGLIPLVREEDFLKIDAPLLADIFSQLAMANEPIIHVGIMEEANVELDVAGCYHKISYIGENLMLCDGEETSEIWYISGPFELYNVKIGKQFHWEQCQNQIFGGSLHIIAKDGLLRVINVIDVEEYLKSVISSEMSSTNSLELLKTHAVISRSWVLKQIESKSEKKNSQLVLDSERLVTMNEQASEYAKNDISHKTTTGCNDDKITEQADYRHIKWYDHDDHTLFDVCADDHCQRYQGISQIVSPLVEQAVTETRGEVLLDSNEDICDARFSKCCGGVSERFSACWQDVDYDYLQPVVDGPIDFTPLADEEIARLDLSNEDAARRWIEQRTENSYCNTTNVAVLRQVLNNYDQQTQDFYRWKVVYGQKELSDLLEEKLQLHVGTVQHLTPLKRGQSGRIYELKVEGSVRTVVIGKELEIRKGLSPTHLYSSAFVVDETKVCNDSEDTRQEHMKEEDVVNKRTDATDEKLFVIRGAGWGHGVGLCQIGAACMSLQGFDYKEILFHYFKNVNLKAVY